MTSASREIRMLRVLLIMDPFIRVPPEHYGGIERVVADLGDELSRRGHEVELWAAPGSRVDGRVRPFGREGEWTRWSNIRNVSVLTGRLLRTAGSFDVIHNFGRLAYLGSVLRRDVPKVQTYMRSVSQKNVRLAQRLGAKRLHFTAVSGAIRDTGSVAGSDWSVIYNCAAPETYRCRTDVDAATAPLVFLGRLERCKGAHTAIEVARRTNRQLIIAGNRSHLPHEQEYFAREVEPHIDGEQIRFIGPVNNEQKQDLLTQAAAFLLPIEWEEPFPVVLPEALLCGTPVLAFRRGGVPEGIDHGRTGFLSDSVADMVENVSRLDTIDRRTCRLEAERRFSTRAVTDEYESLYRRLIA